jgi:chromosome segregation ATPase
MFDYLTVERMEAESMSENNTQETRSSKSFEERVFLRFDAVDARLDSVDARLDSVDARLDSVDARLDSVDARLNSVDARLNSVDARLDSVDTSLGTLEGRVEKLEQKQYDTKPIWEQALAEIAATNKRMDEGFGQVRVEVQSGLEGLRQEMKSEFATLRDQVEHSLVGVEWKLDALNQSILQIKANERYFHKRLHELESQPKST